MVGKVARDLEADRLVDRRATLAEDEHQGLPTEAAGVQLAMSSSSATGYKGVCFEKRRSQYPTPFRAIGPGPQFRHIGYYTTAVDAAVAGGQHGAVRAHGVVELRRAVDAVALDEAAVLGEQA